MLRLTRTLLISAAAALAGAALPAAASAVNLASGDLVVSDKRFPNTGPTDGSGAIFQVKPTTGAQTVISTGGSFVEVNDVHVLGNGQLLVADKGENGQPAPTLNGLVIRVNPVNGAQTIVAQGGLMFNPSAIDVAPDGTIYVADRGPTSMAAADSRVIKINPKTGAQTLVADAGQLQETRGVAVSPRDGTVYVTDLQDDQFIKINPATGVQTPVPLLLPLTTPHHMQFDAVAGRILLADGAGFVFSVNPFSGDSQQVFNGAALAGAEGVARELSGSIVAASRGGDVDRVNNGASVAVSAGNNFKEVTGIDVVERCGKGFATILGTPGKDKIKGTPSADVIAAGGGKDTIQGMKGNDILCGGKGKDTLLGGKGKDQVIGGKGKDVEKP